MRVLVCGGRQYHDQGRVFAILDNLRATRGISAIIHGNAQGADALADRWARGKVLTLLFPAQWDRYGGRAGSVRNAKMLREGKPDLVVAFPGGRGTADMMRKTREAGIELIRIDS